MARPQESSLQRPVAPPIDSKLVDNLRKEVVVPWIGAGFSVPLGFPQMRGLLQDVLGELHQIEFGVPIGAPVVPHGRTDRHAKYQMRLRDLEARHIPYAETAEQIWELTKDVPHEFYTALRNVLVKIEDKNRGQSSLGHYFLSLLGFRRIVTTNYDRLLERHVIPAASVITGADLKSINYYGQIAKNDPVLVKIHGDIGRPDTIPFSADAFEDLYAADEVADFVTDLIQNASILFIGTALARSEKYFDFLKRLFKKVSPPKGIGRKYDHFAFLLMPDGPADERKVAVDERTRQLRELGIRPIWYDTKDPEHSQIYEYLANLASATRPPVEVSTAAGKELRAAYGPDDRPKYLSAQLAFERRAAAITFVTQDLTNAIAPDEYILGDCIGRRLRTAPAYRGFGDEFWEQVTTQMLARRDNLLSRMKLGQLSVRALCCRDGVRRELENARNLASEGDASVLRRLIGRYHHTFKLASESPSFDVRLSDGFVRDAAVSYTPDSYALIVAPHGVRGRADLVMAFAPQATFGAVQTHLIEANSDLTRERAAHAEEMWWSSTPEKESLAELRAVVEEYAKTCEASPLLTGR
jgi:hypothetical protein